MAVALPGPEGVGVEEEEGLWEGPEKESMRRFSAVAACGVVRSMKASLCGLCQ